MKIAFIIKSLALPGGGAERILVDLAGQLHRQGWDIAILSFDEVGATSFYPIAQGVAWHQLGVGDVSRSARVGETLRRTRALRHQLVHMQPDVAVGFMHSAYVPLAFSLVSTGIPVVGSEHIVAQHYQQRRLQYLLLVLSAFFIDRFTVISVSIRERYAWPVRRKATVVPNPVSAPPVSSPAAPHPRERKRILSVGSLEPQKDHLTLLRAFQCVSARHPDWELRIVGEGSLRDKLITKVAELGLEGRVQMPGAVKAIGDEYAAAELFVLPSRYESFGLVTAEAMAFGLPVIGFADCPGTNEIIKDGINGILVEPDPRVENLALAMDRLLASPEERAKLGRSGPATVAQFSPERFVESWRQLLQDMQAT